MSKRQDRKSAAKVVRKQLAAERRRKRTMWVSIAAVAVLVIAGLIGWGVYQSQRSDAGPLVAPASATTTTGPTVGSGPVQVKIYEDFICPFCKQFEESSGSAINDLVNQGRITVTYNTVAFLDPASTTEYSTRSAAAAGCAADAGKFLDYHNALYAQQPAEGTAGLSDSQLISIGTGLGIDEGSFSQCVNSGRFEPWVASVTDAASRAGVSGTPTVLVNDKVVQNPTADSLVAAVNAA
ncbi:thioredoxin domain-containing protein [Asanoa sp. WMMD1127]|uniref:DsbA family protein n=1 Tax=Asanoa sp. WMMD1127 TaxID=3016107 RepID=UPI0024178AD6|nr:thioredoxin domain-containing protein [Asanoa sp. WMMD1127]MDG4820564.1 thioredoxin domain-containing protein [Asanoa sp. WMMD1127]